MAATFNPALPADLDKVRLEIGDTDTAKALIQNETITALLADSGATVLSVSLALARALQARFAGKVDTEADDQKYAYSQAAKAYALLVDDLRSRSKAESGSPATPGTGLGGGIMVFGATSDEVYAARCDEDRARNAWPPLP